MRRTISAMSGPGVVAHNRRTYTAANVDKDRTKDNIEYCYTDIKKAYHELFDEALKEYNAKQTRRDRMIDDYYKKICTGKQEKPFYEVIFQIGNKDDMAVGTPEGDKAKEILNEFMEGFEERNPQLKVFSAHLHMDEATPHLHIDFIPYITGSKRGLSTRVSLKKALEAQGFKGEGKASNERNLWIESEKNALAQVMQRHRIKREHKGTHLEHLDVLNFKKEQRAKEVAELEQRISQLTPEVKDLERLSEELSKAPENILPEATPLESAKNYREKKAKPLFEKMANMILKLRSTIITLRQEIGMLEQKYAEERTKVAMLERLLTDKQKKKLKERNVFHREKSF
ncbi:MAG: plasmid recombination protein [Oscillospiraceae bacterium]|nr:plasmid recombination protein [Oscillospiraceae bacterium]